MADGVFSSLFQSCSASPQANSVAPPAPRALFFSTMNCLARETQVQWLLPAQKHSQLADCNFSFVELTDFMNMQNV